MNSTPIVVTVDNRVRVPRAAGEAVITALKEDFEHKNPELAAKRAIGIPTWNIPTTIKTWASDGEDGVSFPRGGMARVRARLREHGIPFKVVDARTEGAPSPGFPTYVGHPMRGYQDEAIDAILAKEQGIIRAPTGAGKTLLAFAAIARVGLNALVILPTGGLFKQWAQRAEKDLGLAGDKLGVIQGSTWRLRSVTIAMQQTLARGVPDNVKDYFGLIAIDECHLAASRTYIEVVDKFPARYRVAVSANHKRKDKKEFLVHDLFGDVICDIDTESVERDGFVLDVEVRVVPTEFRADWYGLGEGQVVDFNRLLEEMTTDPKRNELACRFIHEEVLADEQSIMLTARREHARTLDRFFVENKIPSGYFLGDQEKGDEQEFERTRAGILDGSVNVGIGTYKALGFGIDLPAVTVGMAVTPIASNVQSFNQVRGRLCRPNPSAGKTQGRFYVLLDFAIYPTHLDTILAHNKTVTIWDGRKFVDAREWRKRKRAGRRR